MAAPHESVRRGRPSAPGPCPFARRRRRYEAAANRCGSFAGSSANGTTGAIVKTFASGGGLHFPQGLTFGPNGDLFVSSIGTNSVLEYNGTTAAFVGTFASGGGLFGPIGLTFGPKVVPEPSGVVLLATGLAWLGLGYVRRRRTSPRPAPAD
jgi:hypothetical protein